MSTALHTPTAAPTSDLTAQLDATLALHTPTAAPTSDLTAQLDATLALHLPDVTFEVHGSGKPFLLLHGGGGAGTVAPFAKYFAARHAAQVWVPTHPGFAGQPRPEALNSIAGLARLYTQWLRQQNLRDVTVVGNSIGGWIAAEMALLASTEQDSPVGRVALVNAVGIQVPGHPVADVFSLSRDEIALLSYHDPAVFLANLPAQPTEAQRNAIAANMQTLRLYAGNMADAGLAERLAAVKLPTLVAWGESDRIADLAYGEAYARAIPGARFERMAQAGHLPQIETPDALTALIWGFAAR